MQVHTLYKISAQQSNDPNSIHCWSEKEMPYLCSKIACYVDTCGCLGLILLTHHDPDLAIPIDTSRAEFSRKYISFGIVSLFRKLSFFFFFFFFSNMFFWNKYEKKTAFFQKRKINKEQVFFETKKEETKIKGSMFFETCT